jgi:SAM-dependent methyltransferase
MPRPPQWFKRLILPVWNGGHRLARRARAHLGALRSGRIERCACCGAIAPMLYQRGVIPPKLVELWGLSPRLAEAVARKESCDCGRCGAKLRARRLARVILELYPVSPPAGSIADWVNRPEAQGLRVAEINRIDGLHDLLGRLPFFSFSDFRDGVQRGAYVESVRNEDLCSLTYADASFDLILSSESLEHLPDLAAGLAETRRVLAPGGRHLFTIPLLPGVERTHARSVFDTDGTLRHLSTTIRHPGGDTGYPVFTEFGSDFPDLLNLIGFAVEIHFGPPTEDDLAQVFVARKRGAVVATESRTSP